MRFINELSGEQIEILKIVTQYGSSQRTRQRAHAIILSHKGYPIDTIADIFEVTKGTISRWFEVWNEKGPQGLFDQPRSGRPKAGKIILSKKTFSV